MLLVPTSLHRLSPLKPLHIYSSLHLLHLPPCHHPIADRQFHSSPPNFWFGGLLLISSSAEIIGGDSKEALLLRAIQIVSLAASRAQIRSIPTLPRLAPRPSVHGFSLNTETYIS